MAIRTESGRAGVVHGGGIKGDVVGMASVALTIGRNMVGGLAQRGRAIMTSGAPACGGW